MFSDEIKHNNSVTNKKVVLIYGKVVKIKFDSKVKNLPTSDLSLLSHLDEWHIW